MRILFLTPYFPPEVGAPQTRIYEMARLLQTLGHEITVLTTFPNYPTGIVPPEWRGKLFTRSEDAGLQVFRVWSYATANTGFYKRIFSQLSFPAAAIVGGLSLPRPDAIVVESPPLFDGFAGVALSWWHNAPYIFNVADLWPEAAIQMEILKNRVLIRMARSCERFFYRHAARILAVTAGIRDAIARSTDPGKVIHFRSAVDTEYFSPQAGSHAMRKRLGAQNRKFLVLYAGTLGLAQQLESVIEAAAMLQRQEKEVRFAFAGEGADRVALESKVKALGLKNVCFAGVFPKSHMPELWSAADLVLVSLRNLEIMRAALPTKMLEAMACGKPILLAAEGEAQQVLSQAGAGFSARPGDADSICAAVLAAVDRRNELEAMGSRGREHMVATFSRSARARELDEVLREVHLEREPPLKPKTLVKQTTT